MARQPSAERPAGTSPEGVDRRAAILETAARLICEKGYEGTSIQDIADASGLTKAGLYHHIRSKEHLLLEIQNYGMDVFEEQVLHAVMPIKDPLERLKECMSRNIHLVTQGWSKEVTIILHEHATLTGEARAHINARKKRYVRFLEESFADAVRAGEIRPSTPRSRPSRSSARCSGSTSGFGPTGPSAAEALAREMVGPVLPRPRAPAAATRPKPAKAKRRDRARRACAADRRTEAWPPSPPPPCA